MVSKQEQIALMKRLDGLCRQSAGQVLDMEALVNDMANACVEATSMIERLGEALDAAVYDLQHMGGCPTCLHNRAPDRNRDIAICDAKRPFPKQGCYVWRFGGRDESPTSTRNSATPNEAHGGRDEG